MREVLDFGLAEDDVGVAGGTLVHVGLGDDEQDVFRLPGVKVIKLFFSLSLTYPMISKTHQSENIFWDCRCGSRNLLLTPV